MRATRLRCRVLRSQPYTRATSSSCDASDVTRSRVNGGPQIAFQLMARLMPLSCWHSPMPRGGSKQLSFSAPKEKAEADKEGRNHRRGSCRRGDMVGRLPDE